AEKGPSASLAPSAARSTYREYASRAAIGRRLAAGPFSPSWGRREGPIGVVGALGCTLNVQRVRLACSHRAPPCRWTLLAVLGPPRGAQRRRWRPRLHGQRTEGTPRAPPSGAALPLDPSRRPRAAAGPPRASAPCPPDNPA